MVFVILHAACGVLPYFWVFVCCMLYAQDGVAEMVLVGLLPERVTKRTHQKARVSKRRQLSSFVS